MHILQVKMTDESALSLAIEGLVDMCQECLKTFIVLDSDKSEETSNVAYGPSNVIGLSTFAKKDIFSTLNQGYIY